MDDLRLFALALGKRGVTGSYAGQMSAETSSGDGAVHRLSRRLRDALRFVHEHASMHITVADVADAVHLSPRALQQAFRNELGQTPGAYLRAVRLEGVRRDLQAAATSRTRRTIAEIAERWQFTNAGRMAAAYRAVYGVAPSSALRYFGPDDLDDLDADERDGDPNAASGSADGTDGDAPSLSTGDDRRRFRLVLDCEVDVEDARAVLAGALQRSGAGPWHDYRPDGGTEDLVAFLLGNAVRSTAQETAGLSLVAVDAMLRVPDERGAYPPAELPAWQPGPPRRTDTTDGVGSAPGREGAHG